MKGVRKPREPRWNAMTGGTLPYEPMRQVSQLPNPLKSHPNCPQQRTHPRPSLGKDRHMRARSVPGVGGLIPSDRMGGQGGGEEQRRAELMRHRRTRTHQPEGRGGQERAGQGRTQASTPEPPALQRVKAGFRRPQWAPRQTPTLWRFHRPPRCPGGSAWSCRLRPAMGPAARP